MAVTVRNILVGAGSLFIADVETALPTWTSDNTAAEDLEASADWDSVGATQDGVEVGYEPDYGEVEVDQLKDAAVLFNQGVNVTMNTNLAEATLENLLVAWGAPDAALQVNGDNQTFSIGVPDEDPVERSAAVAGNAGKAPATAAGTARERVYHARRVVSIEGSTHSLSRTDATVFPVSFRLLPDPKYSVGGANHTPGDPASEYGQILDRVPGS